MQGQRDDVRVIKIIGWYHKRVSQRRWLVGEETRYVVYHHVIQPKLHRRQEIVTKSRNVNRLVDDQDHSFTSQCIIVRESGRDGSEVTIYRTVWIVSSDIDWTVKIMNN